MIIQKDLPIGEYFSVTTKEGKVVKLVVVEDVNNETCGVSEGSKAKETNVHYGVCWFGEASISERNCDGYLCDGVCRADKKNVYFAERKK